MYVVVSRLNGHIGRPLSGNLQLMNMLRDSHVHVCMHNYKSFWLMPVQVKLI